MRFISKKSFSKAAENLFIAQPSLSAMVKKLEKELGFTIFDRRKKPLTTTPKGEIYISYIEECLENEKMMKKRISSLGEKPSRELFIGGGSFLSFVVYPMACREIRRTIPDLSVRIDMGANGTIHNIKDKVSSGTLDLAISYTLDPLRFGSIPILEERYYFTVRRDFPGAQRFTPYSVSLEDVVSGKTYVPKHGYCVPLDLPLLRTMSLPSMNLDAYISDFPQANLNISNMRSGEMYYELMLQGLGVDISSDLIIAEKKEKSQNVLFIPIELPYGKRVASFIYKKGAELSENAVEFIKIVKSFCKDKNSFYKLLDNRYHII